MLFTMLYKAVIIFEFVDEILKYDLLLSSTFLGTVGYVACEGGGCSQAIRYAL